MKTLSQQTRRLKSYLSNRKDLGLEKAAGARGKKRYMYIIPRMLWSHENSNFPRVTHYPVKPQKPILCIIHPLQSWSPGTNHSKPKRERERAIDIYSIHHRARGLLSEIPAKSKKGEPRKAIKLIAIAADTRA